MWSRLFGESLTRRFAPLAQPATDIFAPLSLSFYQGMKAEFAWLRTHQKTDNRIEGWLAMTGLCIASIFNGELAQGHTDPLNWAQGLDFVISAGDHDHVLVHFIDYDVSRRCFESRFARPLGLTCLVCSLARPPDPDANPLWVLHRVQSEDDEPCSLCVPEGGIRGSDEGGSADWYLDLLQAGRDQPRLRPPLDTIDLLATGCMKCDVK